MTIKIVASECAAAVHPRNTLSGFRYCVEQGVPAIEFDVHLSQDSVVVVHHDYKLNPRMTRDAQGCWLAHSSEPLTHMSLAQNPRARCGPLPHWLL